MQVPDPLPYPWLYVAGDALIAGGQARLDDGWRVLPTDPDIPPEAWKTVYADGSAIASTAFSIYQLTDDTWQAAPYAIGVNGPSIYVVDSNDVYVFNSLVSGSLLHLEGERWSTIEIPTVESIDRIYAVEKHLFVSGRTKVGQFGVAHWDGFTWNFDDLGSDSGWALVGRAQDDVYLIVGERIRHFNGSVWSVWGTVRDTESIALPGEDDVLVLARDVVRHYDSQGRDRSPNLSVSNQAVLGELVDENGIRRAALLDSETLRIFEAPAGWSEPQSVPGMRGYALSGTDSANVMVSDGNQTARWNGSVVMPINLPIENAVVVWSNRTTALTRGRQFARCQLSF